MFVIADAAVAATAAATLSSFRADFDVLYVILKKGKRRVRGTHTRAHIHTNTYSEREKEEKIDNTICSFRILVLFS